MSRKILFLILLLNLLLSGCTELYITNFTGGTVRVSVIPPDSSSPTIKVLAANGGTESFFSSTGGAFQVQVIPDEEYRNQLLDLRARITQGLIAHPELAVGDTLSVMIAGLDNVNNELDFIAQNYPSCVLRVADFDTGQAAVGYESDLNQYSLVCGVSP